MNNKGLFRRGGNHIILNRELRESTPKFLGHFSDANGDIRKGLILIYPSCHRLHVFRKALQLIKGRPIHVARSQNHWNHSRFCLLMTLKGASHLLTVTVV